ncbi:peptidylprolyl isomerase [Ramlibacter tataouinensis]|uniref:FKBP-type peptidyl-prolyl cis-trans isomerase n=1 Tax=Ramlibacter tataouinensis TaxID=94132 RepID=UPI0022F3A25C|nr:peptidylprolyl isomerase [Ramlibacter tataouinensis]WBY02428.1 peptidylprolyl isomerase [Ramlibacter tataouinensis]
MHITKDTVVTLAVRIADLQGRLLDQSKGAEAYLHGGYGNTLPKLEAALEGRQAGDQLTLQLAAPDAFGERGEQLVRTLPKREFPPGVKVGGVLELPDDQGRPQAFRVAKVRGDTVHLDGNHPLAGQALRFMVKVLAVRAATPEEIQHRHAHGEHGHHH